MSETRSVVLPEPHYRVLSASRGDVPAVIVLNDALVSFEHEDLFAWHLEIVIEAKNLAENGMPTKSETKALDKLGDQIEKALEDAVTATAATNMLFFARITGDGQRELIYRVHDPEIANTALGVAISKHTAREWSYRMERDQAWDSVQALRDLRLSAEAD